MNCYRILMKTLNLFGSLFNYKCHYKYNLKNITTEVYCLPGQEQHWVALCLSCVFSKANAFVSDIYLFLSELPSKRELGFHHVANRRAHEAIKM